MENVIFTRIKNARKLRALSLQKVADGIGVSKQMVSKYEHGKAIPTSAKLIALAKLFEVKADYFFNPFQVELGEVNFRKKSTFSVKKVEALKEQIKIKLENYLWIEQTLGIDGSFQNPIDKVKVSSLEDVEQAVKKLRRAWDIGTDPIHNIIQLLEDQEVKVIELEDSDDKFDGLATYVGGKYPVIVVNKGFGVERKRFTLLHELGHLLLSLPDCTAQEEERRCHRFAAEFLFPREHVLREFGGKRKQVTLHEFVAAQKKYGISIRAMVFRLKDCGIFTEQRNRAFYQRLNADQQLKKMIDQVRFETPEHSDRFEQLVYRALAQEEISISKASSLLNKSIEQVKEAALI